MPTHPWDSEFECVRDLPRYDATQATLYNLIFYFNDGFEEFRLGYFFLK